MAVSDQMHRGALNTVKNWIVDTLMVPGGEYANRGSDIDERDATLGPVVEMAEFSERRSRVWPTRELKNGRFPKDPEERKIGWWKAEEHEKFARVCGEVVYAGCIDAEGFAVATLVCKVEQIVDLAHRLGWNKERQHVFEALCLAMFVRAEEYLGAKERPLAHDIGRHSLEDIRTHGSLTAFRVWAQERYIRHLVRIPTNGKEIEKTFAKREFAALTSRCLNRRHQEAELKCKGLNGADAVWALARKGFEGVVFVGGQDSAAELTRVLPSRPPSSPTPSDTAIVESVQKEGVVVGSLPRNWRRTSYELLSQAQRQRVQAIVLGLGGSGLAEGIWGPARVVMKSLTKGRANYAAQDFVVLMGAAGKSTERYGRIDCVYVVRDDEGRQWPLVDCSFFKIPLDERGRRRGAPWHNMLELGALQEQGPDRACAGRDLLRHFIPYPEEGYTPASSPSNVAIEVKPDSLGFSASDVKIPLHLQVGEVCEWQRRAAPRKMLGRTTHGPRKRRCRLRASSRRWGLVRRWSTPSWSRSTRKTRWRRSST